MSIEDGNTVVLDENGDKMSFAIVKRNGKIRVGKEMISADPIVGCSFGSVFKLSKDSKTLERVKRAFEDQTPVASETQRDNSSLFDRNAANQKLSDQDIHDMRTSGKEGEEIVVALCSNSATFDSKTEFSKEKYIRKKAKKYCLYVTVRKPTAKSICEVYFTKNPWKIWGLRSDSLAIMLSAANVCAGAKVLVVETCNGLITAAVTERMAGHGVLCAASLSINQPPMEALRQMNLTAEQRSAVCWVSLAALRQSQAHPAIASVPAPDMDKATSIATPSVTLVPTSVAATETMASAAAAATAVASSSDIAATAAAGPTATLDAGPGSSVSAAGGAGSRECAMDVEQGEVAVGTGTSTKDSGVAGGSECAKVLQQDNAAVSTVDEVGTAASGEGIRVLEQGDVAAAAGSSDLAAVAERDTGATAGSGGQGNEGGAGGPTVAAAPGAKWSCMAKQDKIEDMAKHGFDSCLLASPKVLPSTLINAVWPLLRPSATFVIYSPWAGPLAECMAELTSSKRAVAMSLSESWMRPYQVLPARTHPHMTCSGTGGYLLYGIKVLSAEEVSASKPGMTGLNAAQPESSEAGAGRKRKGDEMLASTKVVRTS